MTDIPSGGTHLSAPVDDGPAHPPYVAPEPGSPRSRLVAMGLGIAAVVAGGVFAVAMLSAGSGSASPEEAVERLFAAVGDEDVIGVLEALAPGERSALRPGLEDLAGELQRLGIASDDLDLNAFRGVDVEVDGLTLESEELAGGVAAVHITGGTVTTSTRPEELPVGPNLAKLLDHPDGGTGMEPSTTTEELATADAPMLVAVDDGDGWHVSVFYSLAEVIRRDAGEPAPPFGHGVEAAGADSPEAAVRQAVEAAVDLDVRRLIALTSPAEAGALHDYAPLFLDDAEGAVAELRAEGPYQIEVTRLDLSSETDGDVGQVRVGGFEASGTLPDVGPFSASYDGDCFSFDGPDESQRTCASEMQGPALPMGPSEMVLSTVRHDGQWYLSPTRTVFEQVLNVLRAFDPEDLEDPEAFFESLYPLAFGMGMGMGMAGEGSLHYSGEESASLEAFPAPTAAGSESAPGHAPPAPGQIPAPEVRAVPPAPAAPPEPRSDDCVRLYDELPGDAGPEDYEAAERRVQECLELHGH